MRYCTHCRRITTGEPLFCNFCGRSYDVKLCPARHPNPRSATVCSQCGSHELSMPQPPTPFGTRLLWRFVRILPGMFLLLVTVLFFLAFVNGLLHNAAIRGQVLCFGLILGLLWWVYVHLPSFVRSGFRRILRRGKAKGHEHGHH